MSLGPDPRTPIKPSYKSSYIGISTTYLHKHIMKLFIRVHRHSPFGCHVARVKAARIHCSLQHVGRAACAPSHGGSYLPLASHTPKFYARRASHTGTCPRPIVSCL